MNNPEPSNENASKPPSQRRKPPTAVHEKTHTVIRHPPWTYLHLELHGPAPPTSSTGSTSSSSALDALTARTYITSALSQFLGLTGTAIPIDILHLRGREVWVRVPRGDGSAVVAAVSGWVGNEGVGWRVRGRGPWLVGIVGGDGADLFEE